MHIVRLKQIVLMLLRVTRLMKVADTILLFIHILKNDQDNASYRREHPGIELPPYTILFDVSAGCNYRGYYESGLPDAEFIVAAMRRFLPDGELTVCEWGCGPARVVQHLGTVYPRITRVIGCDYNPQTIAWCKKAYPSIEFLKNELAPPLPLDDSSLDVLYCISVFTHLSEEMHYAWIREIKRVLKPGGLFIGTFHGNKTKHNLLPWELARFEAGELVVRSGPYEGSKNFGANHSDRFVRERLLLGFEEVAELEWPAFHQELYCARKPANTAQALSTSRQP
jgi:SAM-dependent methyltransferase